MDFNELPSHVWSRTTTRDPETGVVSIGGVAVPALTSEFGTPLMVVDKQDFLSRCADMARAFQGPENVHYAAKAFLASEIARWVHSAGLHLDVASLGELTVALRAGFPASDITAHGNNKGHDFLSACVEQHVGTVVIDSFQELERLNIVAGEHDYVQNVLVRVKPGIEAHTHEFIATSHEDQKFGFSLASGSAYKAAVAAMEAPHLNLVGLHCHVGSQVFDGDGFKLAAERVLGLYKELSHVVSPEHLQVLDLGGGFGVAYRENEQALDVAAIAHDVIGAVESVADELGLAVPRVMVEPGRAIVGPSVTTIYSVGTLKDVHVTDTQLRRYIAVDGGMSDNIRPALYDADYDVRVVNRFLSGDPVQSRVVGSHCETGDILIQNRDIPADIVAGDLMALPVTGAYCYAMSSRYNMMMRPAVVAVSDGEATLMLRRETIEDFLSLEV